MACSTKLCRVVATEAECAQQQLNSTAKTHSSMNCKATVAATEPIYLRPPVVESRWARRALSSRYWLSSKFLADSSCRARFPPPGCTFHQPSSELLQRPLHQVLLLQQPRGGDPPALQEALELPGAHGLHVGPAGWRVGQHPQQPAAHVPQLLGAAAVAHARVDLELRGAGGGRTKEEERMNGASTRWALHSTCRAPCAWTP